MTVSNKYGSSVERNLFRRRAKEAFRISTLRSFHGIDIHLRPRGKHPVPFFAFVQAFEKIKSVVQSPSRQGQHIQ